MIPWASPSPQSKWYHHRFSCFHTGDRTVSLYFTVGRHPSKLPFPLGDLDPHLTHGSPGWPAFSTQTASRSVQPFLQGSLVWQTEDATLLVTIDGVYLSSTRDAQRSKKSLKSIETKLSKVRVSLVKCSQRQRWMWFVCTRDGNRSGGPPAPVAGWVVLPVGSGER